MAPRAGFTLGPEVELKFSNEGREDDDFASGLLAGTVNAFNWPRNSGRSRRKGKFVERHAGTLESQGGT